MTVFTHEPLKAAWSRDKRECVASVLGYGGLFLFSLAVFLDIAQANQGLILMAAGLVVARHRNWRLLRRDPMLWLSFIFLLYLLFRSTLAVFEFPFLWKEIFNEGVNWPIRGFFALLVTGFWLSGRPERLVPVSWFMALCGFLTRIFIRLDWRHLSEQLHSFWAGSQRATFGYSSVQLGTWGAIVLWGVVFCAPRWIRGTGGWKRLIAGILSWLPAMAVSLAALLFSQSRSAWLAAMIVFPVGLAGWVLFYGEKGRKKSHQAGLIVLGLITVLLLANLGVVHKRLRQERATLTQVLSADVQDLPEDSVGLRIRMYESFWENWREKPLLGWGPGIPGWLLSRSDIHDSSGEGFSHYHNSYFDSLLQLGFIGFAAVAGMFFLILQSAWQRSCPRNIGYAISGALAIFGLCALTGETLLSANGGYLLSLLGGAAYCWRLPKTTECEQLISPPSFKNPLPLQPEKKSHLIKPR